MKQMDGEQVAGTTLTSDRAFVNFNPLKPNDL
jgi:hypothetical protein